MRLSRWAQTWDVAAANLIVPTQRAPYRVLAVTFTVTFADEGDFALLEIIDGSGNRVWAAAANLIFADGSTVVCFSVNQQSFQKPAVGLSIIFSPVVVPGHLPPDLWVMPNERLRLSLAGGLVGVNTLISMAFPDEPREVLQKRTLERDADGRPVNRGRQMKRKPGRPKKAK
jgi:hypothetical protein